MALGLLYPGRSVGAFSDVDTPFEGYHCLSAERHLVYFANKLSPAVYLRFYRALGIVD